MRLSGRESGAAYLVTEDDLALLLRTTSHQVRQIVVYRIRENNLATSLNRCLGHHALIERLAIQSPHCDIINTKTSLTGWQHKDLIDRLATQRPH